MKREKLVSVIVATAIALSSGGVAFADGSGGHKDRWKEKSIKRETQKHDRSKDGRQRNDNQHDRRWVERGAGPNHDFRRGQRLPIEYRNRQYVVEDWHGHRLSAPPRGYHWVQTGGDYVLIAIASGIILQLILSN